MKKRDKERGTPWHSREVQTEEYHLIIVVLELFTASNGPPSPAVLERRITKKTINKTETGERGGEER